MHTAGEMLMAAIVSVAMITPIVVMLGAFLSGEAIPNGFRFSIRALLVVTTLVAVLLGTATHLRLW